MTDEWFRLGGFFLMFIGMPATYVALWAFVRLIVNKYPKKIWP